MLGDDPHRVTFYQQGSDEQSARASRHVHQIDIAMADELVPGDVVNDVWEQTGGGCQLTSETPWEGGRILTDRTRASEG